MTQRKYQKLSLTRADTQKLGDAVKEQIGSCQSTAEVIGKANFEGVRYVGQAI